jgi:uncharacterized protein YbjT (DUF2867 family)
VSYKRIAITGGTGFVGRHFAQLLLDRGQVPVLIARRPSAHPGVEVHAIGLDDVDALTTAFNGCDGVAHLAGINREIAEQTYERVHVQGTRHVVEAAGRAGIGKIALLSFLRARPDCGSEYHESKFAAEEIVRTSGLVYTILKSGVVFGRGDHLLDHLSHALFTLPIFATVGGNQPPLRPTAVRDLAEVLFASLIDDRLRNQTVSVMGPEVLTMPQVVRRVAAVIERRMCVFPMPIVFHRLLARIAECTMAIPLVSRAQVTMLAEGLTEAEPACAMLPEDLLPKTRLDAAAIRAGLPQPGRFTCDDLRLACC